MAMPTRRRNESDTYPRIKKLGRVQRGWGALSNSTSLPAIVQGPEVQSALTKSEAHLPNGSQVTVLQRHQAQEPAPGRQKTTQRALSET